MVTHLIYGVVHKLQILYAVLFEREQTATKTNRKANMQQHTVSNNSTNQATIAETDDGISSDWVKITLNPILTIADVEELHNQLKQYPGQRIQLSGKNVQRIDTASLQLLLAFMLHPDVTACWVDCSEQLFESAQLLGIATPLGLPTELHG
jgi:ABC-type transporter Mla MlaB component